jgi:hypothetical protein
MSGHEVNVGEIVNDPTNPFGSDLAEIEIIPPVVVGEGFVPSVLGKSPMAVELRHVISNNEVTAFIVEATVHTEEDRAAMIQRLGRRVRRLVETPGDALKMSLERPFPNPTMVREGAIEFSDSTLVT